MTGEKKGGFFQTINEKGETVDLADLVPPDLEAWLPVLRKYRRRQRLEKREIQECLDSGYPPPAELNPLFSQILQGTYSFKYPDRQPLKPMTEGMIARHIAGLRDDIENPESREVEEAGEEYNRYIRKLHSQTKLRDKTRRKSALQLAMKAAADMYGISARRADTIWRKYKKLAQQ